jgi:hypothetical protein
MTPRLADLAPASAEFRELAPLLRRAQSLDAAGLTRLRRTGGLVSALVRLPFGVLAARTVPGSTDGTNAPDFDVTVRTREVLAWLDGEQDAAPRRRDAQWRSGLPPASGWQRIATVPDSAVRPLVRSGALALKDAAEREGLPAAQPRADVAEALLDSVVLTVSDDDSGRAAQVTLRTLSAAIRLGFVPRGSHIAVDVAGRWTRVAAGYGSVYAERPVLDILG